MKFLFSTLFFVLLAINAFSQTQNEPFKCGVNDNEVSTETLKLMASLPDLLNTHNLRKAASNDLYICRLLIEIDSETYVKYNGDTTAIKEAVYRMINMVSKVYESEIQTKLVVSGINIYKYSSADPYKNESDVFNLLNRLVTKGNSYNASSFDMAMYLPTKPFTAAGGVATGRYNVSPWGGLMTIAHELGHNFGSPHTQSCYWKDGPLDKCYAAEGDCYNGVLENKAGTIMSYCSSQFTFHPQVRALMFNYSQTRLRKASSPQLNPPFLTNQEFNKPYLLLNPNLNATKYHYQLSEGSDFSSITQEGIQEYNVIHSDNLTKNKTYYLRIKVENSLDQTVWSEPESFQTPNQLLPPKILNYNSFANAELDRTNSLNVQLQEVEGASSYDIEFIDYSEKFERYEAQRKVSSTTPNFLFPPNTFWQSDNLIFRVRSSNQESNSSWSNYYKIRFLKEGSYALTEHHGYLYQGALRNSPITYYSSYDERFSDIKLTVSENQDLSNPVITQNRKTVDAHMSYLRPFQLHDLKPNQNYYFGIEATREKHDYLNDEPAGKWRTVTRSLRTGEQFIPENTTLFSKASDSLMGESINRDLVLSQNYVYFVTEKGVNQINQSDFSVSLFTPETSKNKLSNRSYIGVDSNHNLVALTPVSSRSGGYDGAFPLQVYSFVVLNEETLETLEEVNFSFKSSNEYLNNFYGKERLVHTNLGLYEIRNGKLENVPLSFNIPSGSQIRKSKNYWWITNNSEGCRLMCFDNNFQLVHTISTCNQSTLDFEGNLYYYHGSTYRIHKYSPKTNTDEILSDPQGISKWGLFTNSYGGIHALGVNRSFKIFSLEDNSWNSLGDVFSLEYTNKQPKVDKTGRLWSNSGAFVSLVNPCRVVTKPNLSLLKNNDETLIQADGCKNTVWGWEKIGEKENGLLVQNSNTLTLKKPDDQATYTAKCYDKGCVSEPSEIRLNGSYYFEIVNHQETKTVCKGQTLEFQIEKSDNVPKNSTWQLVLKNGADSSVYSFSNLMMPAVEIETSNLKAGEYSAILRVLSPLQLTSSSARVSVSSVPDVKITGNNTICDGVGSSKLDLQIQEGVEPYNIEWFLNNKKTSETSSSFTVDSSSEIYAVVKDNNGCISKSSTLKINAIPAPNTEIQITKQSDGSKVLSVNAVVGQTYQWYLNGKTIPNATNPSLEVKTSGFYKIEVTNAGCSIVSNTTEIEIILSKEIGHYLSIFPNPNQEYFFIETQVIKNSSLEVVDNLGRVMWSKKFNKNENMSEKINTSQWSSGKYIVVYKTKNEPIVSKTFVKN